MLRDADIFNASILIVDDQDPCSQDLLFGQLHETSPSVSSCGASGEEDSDATLLTAVANS